MKIIVFIFCLIGALFCGGCALLMIQVVDLEDLPFIPILTLVVMANIAIMVTIKNPSRYALFYYIWGGAEIIVGIGLTILLIMSRFYSPMVFNLILFFLAKGYFTITLARK